MICGRIAVLSHFSMGGSDGQTAACDSRGQAKRAARRWIGLYQPSKPAATPPTTAEPRETGNMMMPWNGSHGCSGAADRHC